jgi:uncharacterized protein (DUF427 family)
LTYRAVWNDVVLAESEDVVEVEGNAYFPPSSVRTEHFTPSQTTTVCPWKGTASYYTVAAAGSTNENAAWYYPNPLPAAENIRDHVAFWRGITVEQTT